ncbi:MAG: hypothetical protein KDA78_11125 [Planctomycetaceae bacterium]|nr:hypothetical protein [Planctomycetaceae bacterium]
MKTLFAFAVMASLMTSVASAQNNGYLGFRVDRVSGGPGLIIRSFIPNTQAYEESRKNPPEIVAGDIMESLNGRDLETVNDVFAITNRMNHNSPPAELILRTPDGFRYAIDVLPARLRGQPVEYRVRTSAEDGKLGGRNAPRNQDDSPKPNGSNSSLGGRNDR